MTLTLNVGVRKSDELRVLGIGVGTQVEIDRKPIQICLRRHLVLKHCEYRSYALLPVQNVVERELAHPLGQHVRAEFALVVQLISCAPEQ